MRTKLSILTVVIVLSACGTGVALDDGALADLRQSSESVDGLTDEDLQTLAAVICEGLKSGTAPEGFIKQAWVDIGVENVDLDAVVATAYIIDAACPEVMTPELAPAHEPIPISFTLIGSDGDKYSYSTLSGCQGEGGYSDIREGMLFNMTDERGEVLGVARLDQSQEIALGCEMSGAFDVTFEELDDDTLYIVGDRSGRRGELAYTGAELRQSGGVELSLG
jgi:hypothetical protein